MEATKNWEGDEVLAVATLRIGKLLTFWYSLVDPLMRPRAVEIPHILAQDTPQMSLADDPDVVEAFATNTPQQSFADGESTSKREFCTLSLFSALGSRV